jgi:glycerol uptake facilitator-like aquaporin
MNNTRAVAAEFLGTLLLVATVVGSGIMAAKLADGNAAVALLGNTIPTGAMLVVLITLLGPVSGAHFNPVVSGFFSATGQLPKSRLAPYVIAQIAGGVVGSLLANAMFDLPFMQLSTTVRSGTGQWLAEIIATFALFGAIIGGLRHAPASVPTLVGLTITAGYWFTSSTSFANPAVTIARMFSDTFAGIAPSSVIPFIFAQCVGAICAAVVWGWLFYNQT